MSPLFRRRFRSTAGGVEVRLPADEQELLRHVLPQLRELLVEGTDPSLVRLRPPARPDDAGAEEGYRGLVDDDLLRGRLEAIDTVEAGIDGVVLDDEGVGAWLRSVNALRLVLAERLDVAGGGDPAEVDPDDPLAPVQALYHWLGWMLEQLVDAASGQLPPADG